MECEGESDGSLGGGLVEHDCCFFVVNVHTTLLRPVLAGIYHGLKLRWRSCYKYHVIDIEECSKSVEVVDRSDFRELDVWNLALSSRMSSTTVTQMPTRVGLRLLVFGFFFLL